MTPDLLHEMQTPISVHIRVITSPMAALSCLLSVSAAPTRPLLHANVWLKLSGGASARSPARQATASTFRSPLVPWMHVEEIRVGCAPPSTAVAARRSAYATALGARHGAQAMMNARAQKRLRPSKQLAPRSARRNTRLRGGIVVAAVSRRSRIEAPTPSARSASPGRE